MNITKDQLKRIITEELQNILSEYSKGVDPFNDRKYGDDLWADLENLSKGLEKNNLWNPNEDPSPEMLVNLDQYASRKLWPVMLAMHASQNAGGLSDEGWSNTQLQTAIRGLPDNEAYTAVKNNLSQDLSRVAGVLKAGISFSNVNNKQYLKLLMYFYVAIKMAQQNSWGDQIQESRRKRTARRLRK